MKLSYIYLIESIDDNEVIYKIGRTKNDPKSRVKQLQTGTASTLILLNGYSTKYASKLEKMLHNHFKHKKIKNEWFRLDLNDVVNFTNICEQCEENIEILINSENVFFKKWMNK